MKAYCISCATVGVEVLVDFGQQPPSNRFLRPGEISEDHHRMVLGQCATCGLLQLIDPMPVEMVRAKFDWLAYNEPESHLDALVERIAKLPGVTPQAKILGISYKDDSVLARLRRAGFADTRRLDPATDLGICDLTAGLETIQRSLDDDRTQELAARYGRADLVVARHILEHAYDPLKFLKACSCLARPGGWMVFEVPDSTKFLEAGELCFIWEEHIAYFTPATLACHFARNGFAQAEMFTYPLTLEDSLIGIVRNFRCQSPITGSAAAEISRGRTFRLRAAERRSAWRAELSRLRRKGRRVALYGAGHLAVKFINLNGVGDFIEFVIDDNPNKQQLRMPGSGLPIVSAAALNDCSIGLCLLSLAPESARRVVEANKAFQKRGGTFRSIFAPSRPALRDTA